MLDYEPNDHFRPSRTPYMPHVQHAGMVSGLGLSGWKPPSEIFLRSLSFYLNRDFKDFFQSERKIGVTL